MLRFLPLLLLFLASISQLSSQTAPPPLDPDTESVYRVSTIAEGLGGAALMLGATAGIESVRRKGELSDETLARLELTDVNRFDRWGLTQKAENRLKGEDASDRVFNIAILLPAGLFIKRKFRKDWLDITAIYMEAHALSASMYAFSPIGPKFVDRYRPIAYYSDIPYDSRRSGNNLNGFFSGHVSTTAVGTFFFTKVLSDYNPQWTGGHRLLAFTLASLPPAFVAVQRVRALKHFPTDCIVGMGVGAFFGVMVPQIHKNWQRKHRTKLSIGGSYGDGAGGAGFTLTF